MKHYDVIYHWKAYFLISAMQNIPSELIITVESYIYITSFKMKGSPDLGQAVKYFGPSQCQENQVVLEKYQKV